MSRDRLNFLFLNVGHFLDHLFLLDLRHGGGALTAGPMNGA